MTLTREELIDLLQQAPNNPVELLVDGEVIEITGVNPGGNPILIEGRAKQEDLA
jgi:hypothetical protein